MSLVEAVEPLVAERLRLSLLSADAKVEGRMMMKFLALAIAVVAASIPAPAAPQPKVSFAYDDLDRFTAALQQVDSGADPKTTLATYIANGSPAFRFYANRYTVTPEALAAEVRERPIFYRRVAALKPRLQGYERVIASALKRLSQLAGQEVDSPIHFLVAHQVAGGTPVELDQKQPPTLGVAIAVDMVSMAPDVDMREFPKGAGGRASLADIPYVAIHEMAHVHQVKAQGGLDNYRSIYRDGPNSTNLAVAIREGCADYLTALASGIRRSGDQQNYGAQHEWLLWTEFEKVMNDRAFSAPGWFSGTSTQYPEWPSQIGYWLGGQMCEHYHRTAADKRAAVKAMFTAYRPDDVRAFAEAYARKFAN